MALASSNSMHPACCGAQSQGSCGLGSQDDSSSKACRVLLVELQENSRHMGWTVDKLRRKLLASLPRNKQESG